MLDTNALKIIQYRKRHKLNQTEFGILVGLSKASIGSYERGSKPVPKKVVEFLDKNPVKLEEGYMLSPNVKVRAGLPKGLSALHEPEALKPGEFLEVSGHIEYFPQLSENDIKILEALGLTEKEEKLDPAVSVMDIYSQWLKEWYKLWGLIW